MAVSLSRPDPTSPASVAEAGFSTARKGYHTDEVRAFLISVAAELRRLDEQNRQLLAELAAAQAKARRPVQIDDAMVAEYLGEETTRVLQTARDSASSIKIRAEERASELLKETSANAAELRRRAEVETAQRRQEAESEAQAIVAEAKSEGRAMVGEARGYRERVLADLERRTNLARQQLEELEHARQRLLQVFERARLVAIDVTTELEANRPPTEVVDLSPVTGPVPVIVPASKRPLPTSKPAPSAAQTNEGSPATDPTPTTPAGGTAETAGDNESRSGVTVTTGTTGSVKASPASGQGPQQGPGSQETSAPQAPDRRNVVNLFRNEAPARAAGSADAGDDDDDDSRDVIDAVIVEVADETEGDAAPESALAENAPAPSTGAPASTAETATSDMTTADTTTADTATVKSAAAKPAKSKSDRSKSAQSKPAKSKSDQPKSATSKSQKSDRSDAAGTETSETSDDVDPTPQDSRDSSTPADPAGPGDATVGQAEDRDGDGVDGLFARLRRGLETVTDVADGSEVMVGVATEAVAAGSERDEAETTSARSTNTEPTETGPAKTALAKSAPAETGTAETAKRGTATAETGTAKSDRVEGDTAEAGTEQPETPFSARDIAIESLISGAARRLKRQFGDEQNAALHLLGKSEPVRDLDDLISESKDQLDAYQSTIADDLLDAAVAGAVASGAVKNKATRAKLDKSPALEASREILAEAIVEVLRARLNTVLADGNGDNKAIARRLRSIYREVKNENIDPAAADMVRAAYGAGMAFAVTDGTPQVWLVDERHPACPDCEDNSLSPPVAAGDEFPTGCLHAPAHPGCRCIVVPAKD